MKRFALTLLMLLCTTTALADGPDPQTITGTTSGFAWVVQDTLRPPLAMATHASCVSDSFSMKVEEYADGAWKIVRFGTGMVSPADEIEVWANQVMPVVGKFHRITFTTKTGDAQINTVTYTE